MDYTRFFAKVTTRRKSNLIRKLVDIQSTLQNPISLAAGFPNTATFPIKSISVTYENNVSLNLTKPEVSTALQYLPSQGYKPLLEKWREFQKIWHTPKQKDWDIIFTNGSMDACSKIFEMMIDENEPIMLQSPLYSGTIGALLPLQPDIVEIAQDADGIIPEQIAEACEQRRVSGKPMPKLLYVNPTGANPSATVLSESRRRKVYELAQKYDFLIVEDDAYYFIHFLDKQPTSFLSLDTDGRVIRLDTFSKIVSSGIRIGAVTAHKKVVEKMIIHMENTSLHSSSVSQMLLYKLFEIWGPQKFEEHFKNVQAFYRQRRDVMLVLIKKHLTDLAEWDIPQGGMFVWLKVTAVKNTMDLVINKCLPNGIFVLPGNIFYYDSSKSSRYLRLCYSHATDEDIDKGLSIVAKVIREEIAEKAKKV
ncbi:kynurenine/alpha-aminoadipate aminotransferase, mitochondrial [Harpegnathos saltator]|uniref:Kynurenine/alpha-aminoadipate aminotransferase mitochondrial n=1 Tax=Harpegnathos saltator TaxID=610380 RepID=E2B5U3_HARSA|nr:kynurenine/alpha-aminoadipate aminotransferase, mitochondrial [Harpegnathos saltator]EFN88912.1 Kynurenine/alpha-aminoadipate aminotransferase mitochondrial [Harpegnathos saltator]